MITKYKYILYRIDVENRFGKKDIASGGKILLKCNEQQSVYDYVTKDLKITNSAKETLFLDLAFTYISRKNLNLTDYKDNKRNQFSKIVLYKTRVKINDEYGDKKELFLFNSMMNKARKSKITRLIS